MKFCGWCRADKAGESNGVEVFICGSTREGKAWQRTAECKKREAAFVKPLASAAPPSRLKTVSCPECGASFERPAVVYGEREFLADRGCLCDACEGKRAAAVQAVSEKEKFLAMWKTRVPEDYHRADRSKIHLSLRKVLDWAPAPGCRRLGVYGPPGAGKSMAIAHSVLDLGMPFSWTNGFAARSIYNLHVSGNDEERRDAGKRWRRFRDTPLLVLDDVDKGNFTEAWAGALFDLLEHRNSSCLPVIWTSNLGPGQIAKKIALKSFDEEQAQAIERRLCDGALILKAEKP